MEPSSRLYYCMLCHQQAIVCPRCDRGQIYCSRECCRKARTVSLKIVRARYQSTLKGRRKHAARQAAYRMRLYQKVTDQGSLFSPKNAPIKALENKAEKESEKQFGFKLHCCFCEKPVSDWLRNHFLRRRGSKKSNQVPPCAQAP